MPDPKALTGALSVFVSYSRRDTAITDALVAALEARGIDVFIDRRDLPYGEKWQGELADSIAAADTVVWLVSPNSVASKWCNWELDEVQKQHKRLVPVRVGPVVAEDLPRQLGAIHILPVEGEFALDQHLGTLVEVLETDRAWLKEHTRLLDRAQQWVAKDRGDGLLLRGRALADAETWQTKQPRRAPQPSPAVMDLILTSQKGAKRRQRVLIGSLASGLFVAVVLGGLALWQSQVAAAESKRVVRATTLSGWRAFEEPPQACLEMRKYTGEEGLRALYCRFREVISYGQAQSMADVPVFLSGPHVGGKLRVREPTFGHYNPAFIAWAEANLLPQPSDSAYLAITRPIFEQFMRRQARAYHRAYVGWSLNLPHFDQERRYLMEMIDGSRPWSYLGARFQADTMKAVLG
ncbi:MAG: toll/interleukin-1 receptor domain-containing protein, partial [Rhizobacter sp.]|nr:toll/interleukin-1 receptor domain-containing protein [Rhizobacter sp.]